LAGGWAFSIGIEKAAGLLWKFIHLERYGSQELRHLRGITIWLRFGLCWFSLVCRHIRIAYIRFNCLRLTHLAWTEDSTKRRIVLYALHGN
jgi:hypothetical protein